jgi:hypothetical protein
VTEQGEGSVGCTVTELGLPLPGSQKVTKGIWVGNMSVPFNNRKLLKEKRRGSGTLTITDVCTSNYSFTK